MFGGALHRKVAICAKNGILVKCADFGGKYWQSCDVDRTYPGDFVQALTEAGFSIEATRGTAATLHEAGIESTVVNKLSEGRPNIVDAIKNGEYAYLINTTEGRQAITDSVYIRREALVNKVTYTTTMNAAFATIRAKSADDRNKVASVQELHARLEH